MDNQKYWCKIYSYCFKLPLDFCIILYTVPFPVTNYNFLQAPSTDIAVSELQHASTEVSEIVFFLLGAMTIVEIVDSHQGFKLVTDNITTRKPRTLLWVVSFCFYSHVDVFLLDIGVPDFLYFFYFGSVFY